MKYTVKQWLVAWFKKLFKIQSPSLIVDGYKYEYDFMKRNRRKYK